MTVRGDDAGEERGRLGVVSSSAQAVLGVLYREEGSKKVSVSRGSLRGLCCHLGLLTVKSQLGGQLASPAFQSDPGCGGQCQVPKPTATSPHGPWGGWPLSLCDNIATGTGAFHSELGFQAAETYRGMCVRVSL